MESAVCGAVIVSWDFSHEKDKAILVVGRKTPKHDVEVVNAFQGQEALDIYKKLMDVKSNG